MSLQNKERNSINIWEKMTQKRINNWMQKKKKTKKQNKTKTNKNERFLTDIWQPKKYNEMTNE